MLAGVAMVRNEEDVIEITLRHHLRQGVGMIFVADHGSTDGTARILARMARADRRIRWTRTVETAFRQSEVVTGLARDAARGGAAWILAFDADEFWYAPGGLAACVAKSGADALSVGVVNFVQERRRLRRDPRALLTATYRCAKPIGDFRKVRHMVEVGAISYVEAVYQRKYIVRLTPGLVIGAGAHLVSGAGGKRSRTAKALCLHLPLRAKDIFIEKARQADLLVSAGLPLWHGWQSHRFAKALREGAIAAEWAANSQRGGMLDAARGQVALVRDMRLRDMLAPCFD